VDQNWIFKFREFDWDEGNLEKNWLKHKVAPHECEQVFFNQPLVVEKDTKHSHLEQRYFALGQTDAGRHLFLSLTVRKGRVRVISARDMSRKEKRIYGA
jgi:uncharacterized protein